MIQTDIGRFSEITNCPELSELKQGMDFRMPVYRRECFLRFYQFHEKYKSHPGAVYYTFPWLFEKFNMNMEQKLWFCFINGLSQNVITTFRLWQKCKEPSDRLAVNSMLTYFRLNYTKFGWDTDRRYVKNSFEKAVNNYLKIINEFGSQKSYFYSVFINCENDLQRFDQLWMDVMEEFYLFGRLSTFSYLEYLKIAGLPIECRELYLYDISGSKSHRNGLCKVLGRDDLDWRDDNPVKYTPEIIHWLECEAQQLLNEAKLRIDSASYFTLESTLCCFKSWFRKNRRYPSVYNDMFYERIVRDERLWGVDEVNKMFRQIRQECLPAHLRVEDNFRDPGLKPIKQNHFRETGQVIMMDKEWPCFKNDFNDYING